MARRNCWLSEELLAVGRTAGGWTALRTRLDLIHVFVYSASVIGDAQHGQDESRTRNGPEAEQPKTTKAQAIRDALAADPKGMPKDIADKLTAAGVSVTANEVSQAKYQLKVAKEETPAEGRRQDC